MLRTVEVLADKSVARGCGFAALAIFAFMVAISNEPQLAFTAGGLMALMVSLALVVKAMKAKAFPYFYTQVWRMMRKEERPHKAVAQEIIGGVLRDVYFRYALRSAIVAVCLLAVGVVIGWLPEDNGE